MNWKDFLSKPEFHIGILTGTTLMLIAIYISLIIRGL